MTAYAVAFFASALIGSFASSVSGQKKKCSNSAGMFASCPSRGTSFDFGWRRYRVLSARCLSCCIGRRSHSRLTGLRVRNWLFSADLGFDLIDAELQCCLVLCPGANAFFASISVG